MIFSSKQIARFMGLQWPEYLPWIGGVLVLFAAFLFFISSKEQPMRKIIVSVIIQDIGWAVGSVLIIASQAFSLKSEGYWLIGIIAVVVGIFAFLQYKAISGKH